MENEILEETVINNTEEFIEEQFEMTDIPEIKIKQVVITGKFNCQSFPLGRYEKTTVINDEGIEETKEVFIPLPHLIEITEEELAQIDPINGTKCFDLENDCVVDYDNTEYSKIHKLEELRAKRAVECFTIINRGQLWYDNLSDKQKEELKVWYTAWLKVTETLVEPTKPEWLK